MFQESMQSGTDKSQWFRKLVEIECDIKDKVIEKFQVLTKRHNDDIKAMQ